MRHLVRLGVTIVFVCFAGLVYGQTEDSKVQRSFLKVVQEEFRSLKVQAEEERDNPEKTLRHFEHDNTWRASYINDSTRIAFIEPSRIIAHLNMPEFCVICFFRETLDKVVTEHSAKVLVTDYWEDGPHPIYEIHYCDQRLAFFHPSVGAPLAAGLLEKVIAYGCRKFMVCGGCGVLDKHMSIGSFLVVSSAVRDEGVSYHYLPPSREVFAHNSAVEALTSTLE